MIFFNIMLFSIFAFYIEKIEDNNSVQKKLRFYSTKVELQTSLCG